MHFRKCREQTLLQPPGDATQHHAVEARVREALAGAEPERVGPADARGQPEAEVEDLGVPSRVEACKIKFVCEFLAGAFSAVSKPNFAS